MLDSTTLYALSVLIIASTLDKQWRRYMSAALLASAIVAMLYEKAEVERYRANPPAIQQQGRVIL